MSAFPDVPEQLRAYLQPRMQYSEPVSVLHEIKMDGFVTLLVVGHPDMGSYEWVLARGDVTPDKHSDAGYGCADIALRDGLIAYHGLPADSEKERLRKIEAAALRVASSRRNGVVTDQAPLDALDKALEAQ
jgi:hypothetical protein